jgi:hypothetical protein
MHPATYKFKNGTGQAFFPMEINSTPQRIALAHQLRSIAGRFSLQDHPLLLALIASSTGGEYASLANCIHRFAESGPSAPESTPMLTSKLCAPAA